MVANQQATPVSVRQLIAAKREDLDELFLDGWTPSVAEMSGAFDGNPLASVFVPDLAPFKWILNLGWFPWHGKVFETRDDHRGAGINMFRLGPFRFLAYRFETGISTSEFGSRDVFQLDYDIEGNSPFIRRVRDDVIRLDSGLYLGRATVFLQGSHRFLAYFALRPAVRNSRSDP